MAVDIETRRLNDHANVVEANYDEELILDSSTYGTRNITVDNLKNQIIGNNNISEFGDGTPTGAILEMSNKVNESTEKMGSTNIAPYGDGTVTGILAGFASKNVLIPLNGWSSVAPFTNTVDVSDVTAQDKIMCLGYVPSNNPSDNILIGQAASRIDYGITGDGTITWYALELKPDRDITMVIVRGY